MVAEAFTLRPPDSRMVALNPAGKMFIGPSGVSICPAAGTDFWRQTWFGHNADNGHALLSEFRGDAELCACVHFRPRHCYDQAGLMVRLSADDWIKFFAEPEPDNATWLGVAATRAGLSDWSGMEWPGGQTQRLFFKISLRQEALVLSAGGSDGCLRVVRIRPFPVGRAPLLWGVYAACSDKAGLVARFSGIKLQAAGSEACVS
ncbi:DUF1349 domain-containing protein [Sodalis praecaptivus]|uniref:DUF1349 domain-containing protein n=1 Tax=Sodalis praecaptivus TaxID=1239307 RepID=UPI0027F802B8|nr:DUF1349 domain-containing protein [Sodalis praecaptivus]CAJ1000102.1 hypothetical protein NVIRENTERO_04156 [Sodalis praecaptivus]